MIVTTRIKEDIKPLKVSGPLTDPPQSDILSKEDLIRELQNALKLNGKSLWKRAELLCRTIEWDGKKLGITGLTDEDVYPHWSALEAHLKADGANQIRSRKTDADELDIQIAVDCRLDQLINPLSGGMY